MRVIFHRKKVIKSPGRNSTLGIFVAKQDKNQKPDEMGYWGSEPYYISISNIYANASDIASFNRDEWNEIKDFIDKSLLEYDKSK